MSNTPSSVDQQRVRRTRTGLIAHDGNRAYEGYTLFTPMFGDGTVYLVDMRGEVVHTWTMPYRPGLYGYLLDNGHLFYSGKVMADLERFEAWARFKAGAALEVDWNGKVVWEVTHPDHHHDARKLRNGNVILLCLRPVPAALHARIKGGLPATEIGGVIYADYLLEMTTRGDIVWEWRSWEHLDCESAVITLQDRREEWTHGNTVAELPDGNLVVSFRNISTVAIIDRQTGAIVWKLGAPPLAQQHDPCPLPNGNLLIFDNGPHRRDHPAPYSRVIEVDPRTSAIVWEYRDQSLFDFFSPYISGAQRLANGNTLICEGCDGRIFEVTPDGQVVWEYVNPYLATEPGRPGLNNWVFRAFRYTAAEIERARRA
jgi:outer membrane protein assembly factor BamB